MNRADSWEDLEIYKLAFELQREVFEESKKWSVEERYSLIDQIRRSSRSVGANVSESWAKRRYPAHFLSKLSDADGELQETHHWISTARTSGYHAIEGGEALTQRCRQLGHQLGSMMNSHQSFCF